MYNKFKITAAIMIYSCCMFISCKKEIKSIDIVAPQRTIDSTALKAYKSNIDNRYVSIGYMYGWGTSDASILMHTPDSLDLIVLKDGYTNLINAQVTDLNDVRSKKATKVLFSVDLNANVVSISGLADTITARQTRRTAELTAQGANATEIYNEVSKINTTATNWATAIAINQYMSIFSLADSLINRYNYDGISVVLPTTSGYLRSVVNMFFQKLGNDYGIGQKNMLIVEGPDTIYNTYLAKANWLVYNNVTADYKLSYFSTIASLFPNNKFLPSADYSNSTDADGYLDTETFGPYGILPRTVDVADWIGTNKGGAALFHIEKNYNDVTGNMTYSGLRQTIQLLQASPK